MRVQFMTGSELRVELPGLPALSIEDGYPLSVELDYWGRNPRLQVLCRNHGDPEGEPAACVRYDANGKVVEVVLTDPDIVVRNEAITRLWGPDWDTAWEIERDANPPCRAGDMLRCPSGDVGEVMRLRDRYEGDIETFRDYSETYGVLARLDYHPGASKRRGVFTSIEQAWDVNPLTVATVHPSDLSLVPELPADQPVTP